MPGILNEISYFQFDNLIRNRIPFVILNLGVDLKNFYKIPLYQTHLESQAINATPETALSELNKLNLPLHNAILVLCSDGRASGKTVDHLEKHGYTNVFLAKDGFQNLKVDAPH